MYTYLGQVRVGHDELVGGGSQCCKVYALADGNARSAEIIRIDGQ